MQRIQLLLHDTNDGDHRVLNLDAVDEMTIPPQILPHVPSRRIQGKVVLESCDRKMKLTERNGTTKPLCSMVMVGIIIQILQPTIMKKQTTMSLPPPIKQTRNCIHAWSRRAIVDLFGRNDSYMTPEQRRNSPRRRNKQDCHGTSERQTRRGRSRETALLVITSNSPNQ